MSLRRDDDEDPLPDGRHVDQHPGQDDHANAVSSAHELPEQKEEGDDQGTYREPKEPSVVPRKPSRGDRRLMVAARIARGQPLHNHKIQVTNGQDQQKVAQPLEDVHVELVPDSERPPEDSSDDDDVPHA